MNKYFTFLLLFSLKAQAQTYKSVVCDSITKQALPSASIRVKDTNLGTTTNTDGKFSLSVKKGIFIVSYIGYMSKSISSSALPDTIFLAESNQLNEVIVMPDSALRVLLRSAYNSIAKNYPQKPTYLTGFYREVNESIDSSRFNYFSESVLKIYKPPYTLAGAEHQGQVKVLKTRKVIHPAYEKGGVRFYGGPFTAISSDRVLKRSSFINPKYFKKYDYELEKISSYKGNPVYVIKFAYKDSLMEGKIYIDKNTLAYIKFENSQVMNKKELLVTRLYKKSSQVFESKDNQWYMIYDKFEADFKNSSGFFKLLTEYTTTNIETDSVKAFAFDDQFAYSGVITRQESNISDNFFEEYTSVLEQTNDLKNQVNSIYRNNAIDSLRKTILPKNQIDSTGKILTENSRKKDNLQKLFLKLTISIGVSYAPINSFDYTFQSTLSNVFGEPKISEHQTKNSDIPILINRMYRYQLNNRWAVMSDNASSLNKLSNSYILQRDYGFAYRFIISPEKKLRFIEPSIKYSNITCGLNFGSFKNPERGIVIDDKKFKTKNLTSGIFQQTEGIKLGISTNIYSRKTSKLVLSVDYLYPIKTSEPYFQIAERNSFFRIFPEKKIRMDINDSRLNIQNVNTLKLPSISNSFWIGLNYRRFL